MTISSRLAAYLSNVEVDYEIVDHPAAASASRIAKTAHIPGDEMVKTVLLHDEKGHLLVALPSTHRIDLGALHSLFDRAFEVADEDKLKAFFPDCDLGSVPPIGVAYSLHTIGDESLKTEPVIYFETGDRRQLMKVDQATFAELMAATEWCCFSQHI
ncbi:MAG: aminoacyl-tRNA deacylase [Geminicoccales bacterium]